MIAPVRIHQDVGAVNIQRTAPRVEIRSEPAALAIERRDAQVSTDYTDYRNAVGARRPVELGNHLHQRAVQAAIQAIGQISAEGDRLARIENPGNTIAAVAQGEMPMDEVDLTLRNVPPPTFNVTPGGVDVQVTPGTLRISWPDTPLRFDVRQAQVTVDTEVAPRVSRTA